METLQLSGRLSIPEEDRGVSVKDEEGQALADLVQQRQCSATLEIGMSYGLSAAYIMSAHTGPHVCIDPYQDEIQDRGVENINQLGFESRLTLHRDFSHNTLPKLLAAGDEFDFAFIDGGHRYDQIFVDFFYCDFLLRKGGLIVFHDTWMRGTQLVRSFIKNNRRDYQTIAVGPKNLGAVRKVKSDQRTWYHFREFYNRKGLLRHKLFAFCYPRGWIKGIKYAEE